MSNNIMPIGYQGIVEVKYFVNGKEITAKTHNKGLNAMFKYICKILAGDINTVGRDKPTYLDVVLRTTSEEEGIKDYRAIYNILSLSKPDYFFDTGVGSTGSWVTRFNIVLNYSMLNTDIISEHLDSPVFLIIKSQADEAFAEFELDQEKIKLTDIVPGTQALIQWTMLFQNMTIE